MATDPLFDAMRFFAYDDVMRAKSAKLSRTAWSDELAVKGREFADELGIEIDAEGIHYKAMCVCRWTWNNTLSPADINRRERQELAKLQEKARKSAASKCSAKAAKPKGSSWGWKKHISDQGHVADASIRWAHLKSI